MTGVQREVAGPIIARPDTTYTLHETAASGSLLNYTTTYSCIDTANGNVHVASGTGASITLPFPATTVVSPNVVCTFTNAPLKPGITLQKSVAEKTLTVGETLHYSFLVTNTGDVTLAPVTINDTGFTGHGTRPVVTCPAGAVSLAPAASVTCTATYTVTQADVDAGSVSNTATASGKTPASQAITSAPSSTTITAIRSPAITVVKSASPTSFSAAGQTIHYSFDVTNSGNVTLTSVKVHDTGLPGLSAIICPYHTPGGRGVADLHGHLRHHRRGCGRRVGHQPRHRPRRPAIGPAGCLRPVRGDHHGHPVPRDHGGEVRLSEHVLGCG